LVSTGSTTVGSNRSGWWNGRHSRLKSGGLTAYGFESRSGHTLNEWEFVVKVLVTGGAGFVGSVVTSRLLDAGHEVVVLDDFSTGHEAAIPAGARVVRGRIHDAVADVLTPDFDAVAHFAAYIAVGESVELPGKYWENNTIGSLRVIEAVRAAGVRRFVFSSTAAVYGDPDSVPIPETAVTRAPNAYAATKLAVDHALRDETIAYGLAATSLRYFNVAGAHVTPSGGWIGERHDPETHLIPIALQVALGQREKLALYGDDYPTPDGTCVRDYIHVTDLAEAHLLALGAMTPGEHRIFNLGNGAGFSNLEVIQAVREVTGHPLPVEVASRRPGDPATLVASSERARHDLGWVPAKPSLREIVGDAWHFARANHGRSGER
jgi:UDP-glucose 4-epimerase